MSAHDYDYTPKRLEWRRWAVFAMVPTEYAQPAMDWLWERHSPDAGKPMVVTHGSVRATEHPDVSELALVIEYAARGANKTDARRKVSQAVTKVAGRTNVQHRVHAELMAYVNLEVREWAKNDPEWLADKIHAARAVADEIAGQIDWPEEEDEDVDPLDQD